MCGVEGTDFTTGKSGSNIMFSGSIRSAGAKEKNFG